MLLSCGCVVVDDELVPGVVVVLPGVVLGLLPGVIVALSALPEPGVVVLLPTDPLVPTEPLVPAEPLVPEVPTVPFVVPPIEVSVVPAGLFV